MLLGCAVGAFFAGRLADLYGRRAVLIVSAVFFLVSAWGSGIATGSLEFVLYRVLGGFAVGAASVMAPAYISEVSSARYRGRLATVQQIAIIGGLFAAFLSNYLLARHAGSSVQEFWLGFEAWRWMFWIEVAPAAVFLVALLFIPESPRYLMVRGRDADALAVLTRLFGAAEAEAKLGEIRASLASDNHRPRLSDLIGKSTGKVRPIVWVGIGLATFQQLVGINVVFYYGAVLWQAVGFSENDALLINVLSGALSIGACLVTVMLIDRIGRKPLLWMGSIGMAASLATVVVAFASGSLDAVGKLQLSDNMGVLALIAANAYVVFFNVSWGPVMWVMLGEMFPNQIRGSGLAVAGLSQWVANFVVTMTFPMLLAGIGLAATYGLYTLAALISVFFVLKYVHETKGKELEQMEG
jgi:SP family sugar:H+ symporter-like MFS transporter